MNKLKIDWLLSKYNPNDEEMNFDYRSNADDADIIGYYKLKFNQNAFSSVTLGGKCDFKKTEVKEICSYYLFKNSDEIIKLNFEIFVSKSSYR